jgi:hypothetical protein
MKDKDLLKNLRSAGIKSLVFNVSLTRLPGWPTISMKVTQKPTERSSLMRGSWMEQKHVWWKTWCT